MPRREKSGGHAATAVGYLLQQVLHGRKPWYSASATAIASGMRLTFLLAGVLTVAAIWIAFGYRALSERSDSEGDRHGGVAG